MIPHAVLAVARAGEAVAVELGLVKGVALGIHMVRPRGGDRAVELGVVECQLDGRAAGGAVVDVALHMGILDGEGACNDLAGGLKHGRLKRSILLAGDVRKRVRGVAGRA